MKEETKEHMRCVESDEAVKTKKKRSKYQAKPSMQRRGGDQRG